MDDRAKTKEQLIEELRELRQRVEQLEGSEARKPGLSVQEDSRMERLRALAAEVLQILNDPQALQDGARLILEAIKQETGIDAVGIRLRQDGDFPYAAAAGFSESFLQAENRLAVRIPEGGFCLDENGNVRLECTCGLVISGRTDSGNPLFTPGGSAWTNDARALLDLPAGEDPRLHPRNLCIHQGFQSVALIPIHVDREIVGLLQLNDQRKGFFTLEMIRFFEGLVVSFGVALLRQREEQALRQLSRAVEQSPACIVITDTSGVIEYVNPKFTELTGYTPEEVRGENPRLLKSGLTPPEQYDELWRTISAGREWRGEFCNKKKNGDLYCEFASISPITDSAGRITHFVAVKEDITERKRAEEALKESGDRLSSIVRAAPTGIGVVRNRVLLEVNDRICEMTGRAKEELVGKSARILYRNDADFDYVGREKYRQIGERGTGTVETQWQRKDGRVIDVLLSSTPIDHQDMAAGVTFTALDITERKLAEEALRQSEERYRALVETSSDWIWEVDERGRFVHASSKVLDILGYAPDEVVGRTPFDFMPGEEATRMRAIFSEIAGERRPFSLLENVNLHRDGRRVVLETSGVPVFSAGGDFVGYRGVDRDITERKRAEEIIAAQRDLGFTLAAADSLDAVLSACLDAAIKIAEADCGGIYLLNEKGDCFDLAFWRGVSEDFVREAARVPVGNSKWEVVTRGGVRFATFGSLTPDLSSTSRAEGLKAIAVLPIIDRGRVIACMNVASHERTEIPQTAREALKSLVIQLGSALAQSRAEEKIRRLEETERALLDATDDAVALLDSEGRVLAVNRATTRLLGVSEADLVGHIGFEVMPPEVADFRRAKLRAVVESGAPLDIEDTTTGRILQTRLYPIIDSDGNVSRIAVYITDVTERRQAVADLRRTTEMLQLLMKSSPVAINMLDSEGRVVLWNPAAERLFGWKEEEILGRELPTWLPEDLEVNRRLLKRALRGESMSDAEGKRRRRDGSVVDVSFSVAPVSDADGALVGALAVMVDVSDRKRAEQEREILLAQLHQSQKMEAIGQLAGGVAHDFNNILTAIQGFVYLAAIEAGESGKVRTYLKEVGKSVEKAADLNRSLLAFSRKQVLNIRPLNIDQTLMASEKFLRRLLSEDIDFQVRLNCPEAIMMADAVQIEQVLMNLAVNAKDAMPRGGKLKVSTDVCTIDNLFVKTHGFGTPGEYVCLTVEDTGTGMDRETGMRAFEPFFTTKEVGKGTGLGLATVYGIVNQHGGYIHLASELGRGTVFTIYLPAALTGVKETERKPEDHLPMGGSETVLLIEDEDAVRTIERSLLEDVGYTVLEASDGEEGLVVFADERERVDLVILDVIMPKMNGKDTYDAIRRLKPDTRVIFLSGYADSYIRERSEIGEDAHILYKPVDPREFLKTVREVLDAR